MIEDTGGWARKGALARCATGVSQHAERQYGGGNPMVRVDQNTTDRIVAWRVRDALAAHPLLGGHMAQITVIASYEGVVLDGWAHDEEVRRLAETLARRAAGARSIQTNLTMRCTRRQTFEHS